MDALWTTLGYMVLGAAITLAGYFAATRSKRKDR